MKITNIHAIIDHPNEEVAREALKRAYPGARIVVVAGARQRVSVDHDGIGRDAALWAKWDIEARLRRASGMKVEWEKVWEAAEANHDFRDELMTLARRGQEMADRGTEEGAVIEALLWASSDEAYAIMRKALVR